MKQFVIRVLWPQPQQAVLHWQCEYSSTDDVQDVQLVDLQTAFQQAAVSQLADDSEVIVLLPGEMAILNCVQMPARSQRQALQALPFVVEEQLADDIEKVHLSVGDRRADGRWPVLVVDLAIMTSLMAMCEQVSLRLKAVYVDAQMLPASEGRLSILMHGDRVLFHAAQAVAVFDRASAASMIHLLLGESSVSHVHIQFQSDDEEQALLAQQLSTEFSALGDTQVSMDATVTTVLASVLLQTRASAINLLQGQFTVRQPSGKLPWWQIAAAAVLFAWIGQLGLQLGSGWYFNYQANVLEKSSEEQYKKLFPDTKHVSNPRKRLESRLLEGANTAGENSFAKLFSGSIQALNSLPNHAGLTIEQLRYEGEQGQLELELKASSIDQLDQFKQALDKLGLSSRISSANDSDGSITGRMQIGKGV
ncbi:MAG TPA: type II secretion system protein GspL [Pseudomonadales bacterium]|nr:type II secretion system protein GspL [Pseudomonadales bacterium]